MRSLASAAAAGEPSHQTLELVIAHWPVPEEPYPGDWLPEAAHPLNWRVVQPDGPYNRGRGRNEAARAAAGDALFFLDADMLVPPGLLERGRHWIDRGKVFFPRYRRYIGPEEQRHKLEHGTGNVFLSRAHFEQFGPWPEHEVWGHEDRDFWAGFSGKNLVVRETPPGFLHQWHPLAPDHASRRAPCPSPA